MWEGNVTFEIFLSSVKVTLTNSAMCFSQQPRMVVPCETAGQWTLSPSPAHCPPTALSAAPQQLLPPLQYCPQASTHLSTSPWSIPTTPCKAWGSQQSPLSTWLACSSSLPSCLPPPLPPPSTHVPALSAPWQPLMTPVRLLLCLPRLPVTGSVFWQAKFKGEVAVEGFLFWRWT